MTTPDPAELQRIADFAYEIARRAGNLAMEMSAEFDVSYKGTTDLVTTVDVAVEKMLSEAIRAEFPDHRMYGEEGARGANDSPWRWLLDPIDGTTNFAHRYPAWCISVCVDYEGQPVVGAVVNPVRDEFFFAVKGQGASLNGKMIHASDVDAMIRGVFAFELSLSQDDPAEAVKIYHDARKSVQGIRINGSAALTMTDVACGRIDGYWQRHLCNYDIGAGVIIAQEAGAIVTMFDGSPYILDKTEVCAVAPKLHDEVIAFISRTDPVGPRKDHDEPAT